MVDDVSLKVKRVCSCLQRQQKMIVLLLLCVLFSLGLSDDEVNYGERYSIRLHRKAQTLEFSSDDRLSSTTIWNRDDPPLSEGGRHKVQGSYYVIESVTQEDSGVYKQKDKSRRYVTSDTLVVTPHMMHEVRTLGDHVEINIDLKPESCNIYFIPEYGTEIEIVLQGRMVPHYDDTCTGLQTTYQCGITSNNLPMSCQGRFEVRDEFNNKALVLTLEMESPYPEYEISSVAFVIAGVAFILCGCCCCLKHCCCSKSSSKKNRSESLDSAPAPAPAPATNYLTYDREPAAPGRDQPSGTSYPAPPSYSPSRPLIHNPPAFQRMPPAYSEVSPPTAVEENAPVLPVPDEDPGPQFKLSFASELPLSSDSGLSHVYTSDKLNF